jgi:hypothetical protein
MSNIVLRPHYFLHDYIASFLPLLLCLVLLMYACIQFYFLYEFYECPHVHVGIFMQSINFNQSIVYSYTSIIISTYHYANHRFYFF